MQCGYCLSGILISAAALLQRNPDPSEAEVRAALDRNLCRCGAHNRIVRAVLRAAKEARHDRRTPVRRSCRPACSANPRLSQLAALRRDGFVELSPGKVEIGQGILTALAQIAADELDIDLARIRMVPATHRGEPQRGHHLGQPVGRAVRLGACATPRRRRARSTWPRRPSASASPPESLEVEDGTIVGPGNLRTSYWELADDALLARDASARDRRQGARCARASPARRRHGSTSPTRCSAGRASSTTGLPGHAARARAEAGVAWAPSSRRSTRQARAPARRRRRRARRQLRRRRRRDRGGGGSGPGRPAQGRGVERRRGAARRDQARRLAQEPAGRDHDRRRAQGGGSRASGPHGPPAVHAALHRARLDGALLRDRAMDRRGQGARSGRTARASTTCAPTWRWRLGLPQENIVVQHVEGAGCYGHNGADDVAFDAVLLARAAAGGPCACSGRARTSSPGRRWAPPWPSRSRPISTRAARSSTGAATCGATATSRAPGARRSRPCSRPRSSPSRSSASSPSIRRWRTAAERSATPSRSTTSPPGASPATACSPCRSAPRRCARSAPSPTCSPSSRSWTSWRPSAARTRWRSACAT